MVDRPALTCLADRLRLRAETVRELAKVCPETARKMMGVARQAEDLAAEIDLIMRGVNFGALLRLPIDSAKSATLKAPTDDASEKSSR